MTRIFDVRGENYISKVLHGGEMMSDPAGIALKIAALKEQLNCRAIRVPYFPEKMLKNESLCLEEMENIAMAADRAEIDVWFDFHVWHVCRKFYSKDGRQGAGFPLEWVPEDSEQEFWKSLLLNKRGLWEKIAAMHLKVVERMDWHPNVFGYELVNEPGVPGFNEGERFAYEQYRKMYQFWSAAIRQASKKYILICEAFPVGVKYINNELVPLMMPDTERMIYSPHRYVLDRMDDEIGRVKRWMQVWAADGKDVRGCIAGEWGVGYAYYGGTEPNPENVREMMKKWRDAGFGWTYFAAFRTQRNIFNADLTLNDTGKWVAEAQRLLYESW